MLYLETSSGFVPWRGEPINEVRYPTNIEALWSSQDLAALGLYAPAEPTIPPGTYEVSRSVERVDDVVTFVAITEPVPTLGPSDYPLADWQLRKGLVLNGYSIDAIEATIKAIPDQAERELRWNAWDRPSLIHWDAPATQEFMAWLGIPQGYAEDMWMIAKDYTL